MRIYRHSLFQLQKRLGFDIEISENICYHASWNNFTRVLNPYGSFLGWGWETCMVLKGKMVFFWFEMAV